MLKKFIHCAMPVLIFAFAGCGYDSQSSSDKVSLPTTDEISDSTPVPIAAASANPSPSLVPGPTPTPVTSASIQDTTGSEVTKSEFAVPIITGISTHMLYTKDTVGLEIAGENLTSSTFVLRNKDGKEVPLETYEPTATRVTVPDKRYSEDTAGIYQLIAIGEGGHEFVFDKQITISNEK